MVRSFTDLEVYQLAEKLSLMIYKMTAKFPEEEKYGLTSQLRRTVISIGANIAESFGRFHYRDKIQFLYNARGSLFETHHFVIFASKAGFLSKEEKDFLSQEINKIGVKLNNYIKTTFKQTEKKIT